MMRAAALGGRVRWLGQVDEAGKRRLFERADLLASPSAHENFGLAVAEAMAAGRAVVVSPEVALAGAIERAGAGAVVEARAEPLAATLSRLLDDGPARAEAARRAHELAATRFGWGDAAQRTLTLYQSIAR
jgi:glycosyltransferase involved in cell wall biosynthesis